MALIHNVEIVWDELMDAFSGNGNDRVYFLDRYTGDVFFVPATLEDDDFWGQIEKNHDRFLEIPRFDYGSERQIMAGFVNVIEDADLKNLLRRTLAGRTPYGNIDEILSFFPEELEKLHAMKEAFFSTRVKNWLEENNLYTADTAAMLSHHI